MVDMELEKPLTIKAKTPLEKEIARLKGYNSSDINAINDLARDFD